MDNFVFVVFDDEASTYDGLRRMKRLHAEGSLTLYGWAVVKKEASGSWAIKDINGSDLGAGTAIGSLTGALIGLIGGPVGALVGVGTGALVGMLADLRKADVSGDFLQQAAEAMDRGSFAILAEVTEAWEAPLEIEMGAGGGRLIREPQLVFEAEKIEREAAARRAELDRLKAELKQVSHDQRTNIEKQIGKATDGLKAAAARLDAQRDKLVDRTETRIKALEQQIAETREERRLDLTRRLAETRADLDARKVKIGQALDLAKQALGPDPQHHAQKAA
jgi:uncharacterized membrane protein